MPAGDIRGPDAADGREGVTVGRRRQGLSETEDLRLMGGVTLPPDITPDKSLKPTKSQTYRDPPKRRGRPASAKSKIVHPASPYHLKPHVPNHPVFFLNLHKHKKPTAFPSWATSLSRASSRSLEPRPGCPPLKHSWTCRLALPGPAVSDFLCPSVKENLRAASTEFSLPCARTSARGFAYPLSPPSHLEKRVPLLCPLVT